MSEIATTNAPLPADDLSRALAFAQLDSPTAQHIGLVGNTYPCAAPGQRPQRGLASLFAHDSAPKFREGVAGRNGPQRWEAENRRIEAREETCSRQDMNHLPSVGRVLTMDG